MRFFDFEEDVSRAMHAATDDVQGLSAKTSVHRARLPGAVTTAGFRYLHTGESFSPGNQDLVIGVAAWSDSDLAALDELASQTRHGPSRITIYDIDDLTFPEMLRLFPGIRRLLHTPVVMQYAGCDLTYYGEGYDAVLWLRQR